MSDQSADCYAVHLSWSLIAKNLVISNNYKVQNTIRSYTLLQPQSNNPVDKYILCSPSTIKVLKNIIKHSAFTIRADLNTSILQYF